MIKKFLFYYFFASIFLLALLIRFLPAWDNNFYFTMDQGNDAIHVREVTSRGQIFLLGPPTGIGGLFAGPLWYYFIAIGYFLLNGHPFGSVLMLVLLNVFLTGFLIWWIGKKVSPLVGLITGLLLQFFWPFYETSRYGFNPFPQVALSFFLIYFLLEGRFILAAIPVGLAFHSEVAFAVVLLFYYLAWGILGALRKKIALKTLLAGSGVYMLFLIPHVVSELMTNFAQTHTFINQITDKTSLFSQKEPLFIIKALSKVVGESVIAQNYFFGLFFLGLVLSVWSVYKKSRFIRNFAFAVFGLLAVALLFFLTNKGWQDWQTIALPSLIYVSLILICFDLPKKIGLSILLLIFLSQTIYFGQRYGDSLKPSGDPSLLKNELAAIDWVYQEAQGEGFSVYSYLPSVYDYPYQYLFWWQGRKKYGYLPCEYTSYPGAPGLFVPGKKYYSEPKKDCSGLRFLVIEPDKNTIVQNQWLAGVQEGSELLEKTKIGSIAVEKRFELK